MPGKPLLPTLRTKKRYAVFEVISKEEIDAVDVFNEIKSTYKKMFGLIKESMAEIKLIGYDNDLKRGIIKINHKFLNELRFSTSLVRKINNKDAIVHICGVSGILRKAKKRYMEKSEMKN